MRLWPWGTSKVDELLAAVDEVVTLLNAVGHVHWAEWMRKSAAEIRAGDEHGVERALSAYGGMGSFNDVWFDNPRIPLLRSRIFMLADGLRREGR